VAADAGDPGGDPAAASVAGHGVAHGYGHLRRRDARSDRCSGGRADRPDRLTEPEPLDQVVERPTDALDGVARSAEDGTRGLRRELLHEGVGARLEQPGVTTGHHQNGRAGLTEGGERQFRGPRWPLVHRELHQPAHLRIQRRLPRGCAEEGLEERGQELLRRGDPAQLLERLDRRLRLGVREDELVGRWLDERERCDVPGAPGDGQQGADAAVAVRHHVSRFIEKRNDVLGVDREVIAVRRRPRGRSASIRQHQRPAGREGRLPLPGPRCIRHRAVDPQRAGAAPLGPHVERRPGSSCHPDPPPAGPSAA
jgi:hypothetical protein